MVILFWILPINVVLIYVSLTWICYFGNVTVNRVLSKRSSRKGHPRDLQINTNLISFKDMFQTQLFLSLMVTPIWLFWCHCCFHLLFLGINISNKVLRNEFQTNHIHGTITSIHFQTLYKCFFKSKHFYENGNLNLNPPLPLFLQFVLHQYWYCKWGLE